MSLAGRYRVRNHVLRNCDKMSCCLFNPLNAGGTSKYRYDTDRTSVRAMAELAKDLKITRKLFYT